VADQKGRPRRLFNPKGARVDPGRPEEVEALNVASATLQTVVKHVYQQGFPSATPHEQALDTALVAAAGLGQPLSAEIVQTPEHEAAGEFLVKVLLLREGRGEVSPGPRT
jgi:hypothetical protein